MAKVICPICNESFKNEEGLALHTAAKHPISKKEESPNSKSSKKLYIFITIIIAVGLLIWGAMAMFQNTSSCQNTPAKDINIGSHQNLKLHMHTELKILIDGREQVIPSNIGIGQNLMRPVHTHDISGEIHMEGPCKRDFTLGDFFSIWEKTFDNQCIFNYCTNKGTLTMTVNSQPNFDFDNYVMKDHDQVLIKYTSNK